MSILMFPETHLLLKDFWVTVLSFVPGLEAQATPAARSSSFISEDLQMRAESSRESLGGLFPDTPKKGRSEVSSKFE